MDSPGPYPALAAPEVPRGLGSRHGNVLSTPGPRPTTNTTQCCHFSHADKEGGRLSCAQCRVRVFRELPNSSSRVAQWVGRRPIN